MNIAIDLTAVPKSKSGVGRYAVNLIEGLQKLDWENHYYLFIQDDDTDGFVITNSNFKRISVSSKKMRSTFIRLMWEQIILPLKLSRLNIDLLHSPHYTMPYFSRVRKIVTFHDMTYFIVPEMHTWIKRMLFKLYIRLSAKLTDSILTISHATEKDIREVLKTGNKDIIVTPMGVDYRFFENAPLNKEILKSYGIESDYFLYVGTIEPRKNLLRALTAYSELKDELKSRFKFVLCGKKGWMYDDIFNFIKAKGLENNVHFTGFVKDEHLPCIYRAAELFIYVSLYEGFGIPVIEAMASGVPCITSNLSSMKEVSSNCCYEVDPYNVTEIKQAIEDIVKDETLSTKLRLMEKERAKLYSWENCARNTLKAYMNLSN